MIVIGLDPGAAFGYAFTHTGKVEVHQSGVWDLSNRRFSGGGMKFLRLRTHLTALFGDLSGGAAVFFEEVRRHRGVDASHAYGGWVATIASTCEEHGVPYQGIPVGTIKRRATGKGNAGKEAMITAAITSFDGVAPPGELIGLTDDQADAMWVLQCGLDELGYEGSPAPESEEH